MFINNRSLNYSTSEIKKTHKYKNRRVDNMSSVTPPTSGINADILSAMKASKKTLNTIEDRRQESVTKFKEVVSDRVQATENRQVNIEKGMRLDVTI